MSFIDRVGNVYLIDAQTSHAGVTACYLVKGAELAMVDTGPTASYRAVSEGIKAHGFKPGDITRIFITHCEHGDHAGGAAALLREAPEARVYVNPTGAEFLTGPETAAARAGHILPPEMIERFGTPEPVPPSRVVYLHDGDEFDLGEGEKLKVIFTPAHQPSGLAIWAEKTQGLFVNDIVGLNYTDADASLMVLPMGCDPREILAALARFRTLPVKYLYCGHFGIWDDPPKVFKRAANNVRRLLAIGAACLKEGRPEDIPARYMAYVMPELEKVRAARGEEVYRILREELVPHQAQNFARCYLEEWPKSS